MHIEFWSIFQIQPGNNWKQECNHLMVENDSLDLFFKAINHHLCLKVQLFVASSQI